MALPRQKKKSRSRAASQPKKRSHILAGRTKRGKKKISFPGGNAVVAENWDRSLTVQQNYRRLGLVGRLNGDTGGVEKRKVGDDVFAIGGTGRRKEKGDVVIVPTEVQVERDTVTGRIVRVIHPDSDSESDMRRKKRRRRLDDPLNELDSDSDSDSENATTPTPTQTTQHPSSSTSIIPLLESQADLESSRLAQQRKPRHQSRREEEWIATLVAKYGTDDQAVKAMARDRRLNSMQQSEGDIRRRVGVWIENQKLNEGSARGGISQ